MRTLCHAHPSLYPLGLILALGACGGPGDGATSSGGSTGRATSSTSSSSSGSSSSSSGGSTGVVKPAPFAFCTQPDLVADIGDLGLACTPAPHGNDAGQGSCGPNEICVDFGAGPKCTVDCGQTYTCPGTSQCYGLGLASGGTEDLCMASCSVDGGACPGSLACTANTPNPADPGVCLPGCTRDSQCNASGGGTAFACSGGTCHCTQDADCQEVPDAGFACDVASGSCYLPCGARSGADCLAGGYSWGCCAEIGRVGYCDLMLPDTGWSGGAVIPDAGFCAAPSINPGDPGTLGDGGCLPSQANSCPSGFACAPSTPGSGDPGTCQPACAADGDCNAPGAGTALTCSQGVCKCSTSADCPLDQQCDAASGACYTACGPALGIGCDGQQGCCVQLPAGTGGYCDAWGSAAPAGFTVGPHNPWPQVTNPTGGPVLANLQLVTITFNPWQQDGVSLSYPFQDQVEAYDAWLVTSPWLAAVGADYGVGLGTAIAKRLNETPPAAVLDGPSTHGVENFINARIAAGALPDPGVNTLYAVYYPFDTLIYDADDLASSQSCETFDAYHSVGRYQSSTYSYAVIPDCGNGSAEGWDIAYDLQGTEGSISHEVIEAATDPQVSSWYMQNPGSPWNQSVLFYEVADMCITTQTNWVDPQTGFLAQRTWSASAARSNGSPCAPVLLGEPFAASSGPTTLVSAPNGTQVNIPFQSWSTQPVPDWTLYLEQWSGGPTVSITPSAAVTNNGKSGSFSVGIPPGYTSGDEIQLELVAQTTPNIDTEWWPVVIQIK